MEVLHLVVMDFSKQEIAYQLIISHRTHCSYPPTLDLQ